MEKFTHTNIRTVYGLPATFQAVSIILYFLKNCVIITIESEVIIMLKFLLVFLVLILYKFSTNLKRYIKISKLKQDYISLINMKNKQFPTYKREVITLMKKANTANMKIPTAQPVPGGKLATFTADVFSNFPSREQNLYRLTILMFDETIGVYRSRYKESFNPFYWIDLLVFAPRNALNYFQADFDKIHVKIINVLLTFIWWCFSIVCMVLNIEFSVTFFGITFPFF